MIEKELTLRKKDDRAEERERCPRGSSKEWSEQEERKEEETEPGRAGRGRRKARRRWIYFSKRDRHIDRGTDAEKEKKKGEDEVKNGECIEDLFFLVV